MQGLEIAQAVKDSPALLARMQEDPVATLESIATPLQSDKTIYRVVVFALGMALLGSLGGLIASMVLVVDPPDGLLALGTGALGVLGGLLAKPPQG